MASLATRELEDQFPLCPHFSERSIYLLDADYDRHAVMLVALCRGRGKTDRCVDFVGVRSGESTVTVLRPSGFRSAQGDIQPVRRLAPRGVPAISCAQDFAAFIFAIHRCSLLKDWAAVIV